MNPTYESLKQELLNQDIKLSHQRLKILEFMASNVIHPTVDQVYQALHHEIPTLSKTTVYNTLNLFVEVGLCITLATEENEIRYDIHTFPHGHFKCKKCNQVYNVDIDTHAFTSKDLVHFEIHHQEVFYKGICEKCLLIQKL